MSITHRALFAFAVFLGAAALAPALSGTIFQISGPNAHQLAVAKSGQPGPFLVVHGIPGRDIGRRVDPALPIDFQIGATCLLSNFTFGNVAGPFDWPPGVYLVSISLANPAKPCSNPAIFSGNFTVVSGVYGAVTAELGQSGAPTVIFQPFDVKPVPRGSVTVYAINASAAPVLTVNAQSLGPNPAVTYPFGPLYPNESIQVDLPFRPNWQFTINAGDATYGPIDAFNGGLQSFFFTAAVGNPATHSLTVVTKVIPGVF